MHPRFLTTWICLCILHAEMQQVCAQQAMIRTYTVGDGLVMNRVRGFHQDTQGFIWIYTWDGLSRYEGYRFRNYITGQEFSHGLINDMVEYPDGSIYVAFNDGTVEEIRDLEVQSHKKTKGPVINSFFKDDDGQWLAATDNAGICEFNRGSTKSLSAIPGFGLMSAMPVSDDAFDDKDAFLFVGGYHQPSGILNTEMQFIRKWDHPFFLCIYRNNNDRILVGTIEGLMEIKLSGSNDDKYALHKPDFIPDNAPWKNWWIDAIAQSDDGSYWIGTKNGLIKIGPDKGWVVFTKQDGLPSNTITSLLIDRSNTLWIGTDVGAASLNLTNSISRFNAPDGMKVNQILPQPGGYVYCVTESHIYSIDPTGKIIGDSKQKNALDRPQLIEMNGTLLLVQHSTSEIWPSLGQTERFFSPIPTPAKYPSGLNNKFYTSSSDGVMCCSPGGSCNLASGFKYRTEAIAKYTHNTLLLGSWLNGLFLVSIVDSLHPCDLHIENDLSRWLPGKEIRSVVIAGNRDIWVGTRNDGLVRLRCDEEFDTCDVKVFNMASGLMSNWISSIAEDHFGNLWIGSTSGLDKLIPQDDGYRVFSFSRAFGFFGHIIDVSISSDNVLWCGTSEGYARIVDGGQDTMPPFPVYITEANLGGKEQHHHILSDRIVLPYNKNSANFAFASPNYATGKQLAFAYRLFGSKDTLWSAPGNHQQIFYGNLLPGSYKFEVASIGLNGERGKSSFYPFAIKPPFWQQYWFITLVISAIILLLYGLHRFRISQIERTQKVRDRIASDLHDEIGSTLTHVNILSEFGKQTVDEKGKPADIFEKIGAEMQSSSEALDDIIWSVKNRRDAIEDVVARMRKYATELLEPAGITYIISEETSPDQQLDMELRRDLYLAFKELLRNIVRHAGATDVDIHIHIDRRVVRLFIRDNGKGFDILAPTHRNGLKNIRKRALRWHGNADWNSSPGLGTEVVIEMKLH